MLNYPAADTIRLDTLDQPFGEQMEAIPLEKRESARLLCGHMPYGAHRHMPRRCRYVTILRDPVARVISVYKYILRARSHVLHVPVVDDDVSLEEYIESGMDEGQTENSQTRQLSGRQFGALDRDALADAQRNLESFLVVGLTERFEETFVLMRRSLKLRRPLYITRNVSAQLEISQRAVALIRERNDLDLDLYMFARHRFEQKLAEQDGSFDAEVRLYRALSPLSRAGAKAEGFLRAVNKSVQRH